MNGEVTAISALGMVGLYVFLRALRRNERAPTRLATVERVQTILPGVRLAEVVVGGDRLVLAVTAGAVTIIDRRAALRSAVEENEAA